MNEKRQKGYYELGLELLDRLDLLNFSLLEESVDDEHLSEVGGNIQNLLEELRNEVERLV